MTMTGDVPADPPDLSEQEVERLVDRLNSMREGAKAAAALVGCGRKAIAPLRRFLLGGMPSGIFQPRQHAVEALAALQARDVLIEYLGCEREITDPVERYGEEAVINTAARCLAEWRDEETCRVLLRLVGNKAMPGVIEALGDFRNAEAVPHFIVALGDSIGGIFAEEALRKAGEIAHPALLEAALTPRPSADGETPSSLFRRRSSLRLLSELALSAEDWRRLSPLTKDRDPEIAARANRIALAVGDAKSRRLATKRLTALLPELSWPIQAEIEGWLLASLPRPGRC